MTISLASIISFTALVFYTVLLIINFRQDFRSRINLTFGLYLFTMIVWSFGSLLMFLEVGVQDTLFWNRVMVLGSTAMPIAFFVFVQEFLLKDRKFWLLVGLLSYLGTQLANALGYVVTDAYIADGLLHNQYGSAIALTSISWVLFIGFSTRDLLGAYRKTKDVIYRNRIKYLLIVIIVIFIGSLTNASELRFFPIDIAFNVISALLISYAILRHQLLEINVVIRKGLLYSIPTVFIGAAYFMIISLTLDIFHASSEAQLFVISLIVAVLTALVALPFRDKAQSWIDRLFFREKYDLSILLERISRSAATDLNFDRLTNMILREVTSALHITEVGFFLRQEKTKAYKLMKYKGEGQQPGISFDPKHPLIQQLTDHDQPLTMRAFEVLPQYKALWEKETQALMHLKAELFIPLKVQNELVGVFTLGPKRSEETYSKDEQDTLLTLASQIAVAIDNARLYELARQEIAERKQAEERLQLQLRRMGALHTIDTAITSSVNLEITLRVILDMITSQLNIDASAVSLIRDSQMHKLEYVASRGFFSDALHDKVLSLGDGLAGRVALEQKIMYIEDLDKENARPAEFSLLNGENFVTYYGVPLLARGRCKGVLEVFHRSVLAAEYGWLEFLKSLAAQTAIAIDTAEMFNDLQQSNVEMNQAYVTTLEGWSRALELRDRETEGHTQRVTKITLELARMLTIKEGDLVHIHRGALLHDIGKMGIPDNILLKPGPLSDEEWAIMRQHPTYAFKLLSSIPFLRPALDIPHYHHEKWDGTGYPLGLKGEEIPLAARIFAIVDVYDALVSDRPYRPAWSQEATLAYIKEQKNAHFDPVVVDAFFQLLKIKPELFQKEAPVSPPAFIEFEENQKAQPRWGNLEP